MIYLCITVDGLLGFPHPCNARLLAPARICVLYPRMYLSSKVFLFCKSVIQQIKYLSEVL